MSKDNKQITTEDLAIMIAKGFKEVDERFNKVDGRFNKIEYRLEILEKGQKLILAKLNKMVYKYKEEFDRLAERVKILEETVGIA